MTPEEQAAHRLRAELSASPGTHWRDCIERHDVEVVLSAFDRLTAPPSQSAREEAERCIVMSKLPPEANPAMVYTTLHRDATVDAIASALERREREIAALRYEQQRMRHYYNLHPEQPFDPDMLLEIERAGAEAKLARAMGALNAAIKTAESSKGYPTDVSRRIEAIREAALSEIEAEQA